jgi:hypothetical protein
MTTEFGLYFISAKEHMLNNALKHCRMQVLLRSECSDLGACVEEFLELLVESPVLLFSIVFIIICEMNFYHRFWILENTCTDDGCLRVKFLHVLLLFETELHCIICTHPT